MTNQHPITPPPELWKQFSAGAYTWKEAVTYAYRAGADQELEACCEYLTRCAAWEPEDVQDMLDLRRPKPPSLKEQGIQAWCRFQMCNHTNANEMNRDFDIVRRALEALPDD